MSTHTTVAHAGRQTVNPLPNGATPLASPDDVGLSLLATGAAGDGSTDTSSLPALPASSPTPPCGSPRCVAELTIESAGAMLLKYTPAGVRQFASLEQMSIAVLDDLLRVMYAVPSLSAAARTHPNGAGPNGAGPSFAPPASGPGRAWLAPLRGMAAGLAERGLPSSPTPAASRVAQPEQPEGGSSTEHRTETTKADSISGLALDTIPPLDWQATVALLRRAGHLSLRAELVSDAALLRRWRAVPRPDGKMPDGQLGQTLHVLAVGGEDPRRRGASAEAHIALARSWTSATPAHGELLALAVVQLASLLYDHNAGVVITHACSYAVEWGRTPDGQPNWLVSTWPQRWLTLLSTSRTSPATQRSWRGAVGRQPETN